MVRIGRFVIPVLSLLIIAAMSSCKRQPPATSDAQLERNRTLVRRWIDAGFNQRTLPVVDEVFNDSVAINGVVIPRDGLKQSMGQHFAAFPDLRVTIDAVVAEGRSVGIWYTGEGTQKGTFGNLPATGKHVIWKGVDLFTFQNGKVSEATFLSELPMQLSAAVK
jgi:steroid delta-isomerase-like uncharacterized protein